MVDMFWSSNCGRIELEFKDSEQVFNMYHGGKSKETVKAELPYFKDQLAKYDRNTILSVLTEMFNNECQSEILNGAISKMHDESKEDLQIRILWIAAYDKHDEINMDELCEWQNDFLADRRREIDGE